MPCQLQLTVLVSVPLCFLAAAPRDQLRFLKDEIQETKKAVKNLDEAVAKALSFREKSSRLLEEAHRALSRLEQVRLGWNSVQLTGGMPAARADELEGKELAAFRGRAQGTLRAGAGKIGGRKLFAYGRNAQDTQQARAGEVGGQSSRLFEQAHRAFKHEKAGRGRALMSAARWHLLSAARWWGERWHLSGGGCSQV